MKPIAFLISVLMISGCIPDSENSKELLPDFAYTPAEFEIDPLEGVWEFAEGDTIETLNSFSFPLNWTEVNLPHRTLPANRSFYYRMVLSKHDSMLLEVNADDGAQVYAGMKKLSRKYDIIFELPASEENDTLIVRVLNNAMMGGLRQVNVVKNWKTTEVSGKLLVPPMLFKKEGKFHVLWEVAKGFESSFEICNGDQSSCRSIAYNCNDGVCLAELPPDASKYRLCIADVCTKMTPVTRSEDKKVSFAIWADSQGGWETFRKLSEQMQASGPDFSIGIGDLVAEGSDRNQWRSMLNAAYPASSEIPLYLVPGNHDYDGYYEDLRSGNYHLYYPIHEENSWYWWKAGPAVFAALDANKTFPLGISGNQRKWLNELISSEEWLQASWKFILIHQPPYSQGWPGYSGDDFVRQLTDSLVSSGLVDVVLSGHSHNYERLLTHNALYIVSGGAGGGLEPKENSPDPQMDVVESVHHFGFFEVSSNELEFRAVDLNGRTIDSLHLDKVRGK